MEETLRKDTMADRLQRFLPGRGFLPVNLHAEGMSLYYRTDEGIATLVWIIGDQALSLLDAGQYRAQGETIRSMFLENGMQTIHTLTLFLSSDITKARAVGEGTPFWIVDEAYGRLVIYENQPEEFAGLKSMIEQNLHFGAARIDGSVYGTVNLFVDVNTGEYEEIRADGQISDIEWDQSFFVTTYNPD